MVKCLKDNNYSGDICLPVEYSNPSGEGLLMGDIILPLVKYDMDYINYLFAKADSFDDNHLFLK